MEKDKCKKTKIEFRDNVVGAAFGDNCARIQRIREASSGVAGGATVGRDSDDHRRTDQRSDHQRTVPRDHSVRTRSDISS